MSDPRLPEVLPECETPEERVARELAIREWWHLPSRERSLTSIPALVAKHLRAVLRARCLEAQAAEVRDAAAEAEPEYVVFGGEAGGA